MHLLKIHTRFILLVSLYSILNTQYSYSQPSEYKMTEQEYIKRYKEDAVKEMLMHGIPASIIIAQGMLESGNGNSALAVYANNHFGIKCHKNWSGPSMVHDDDEKNECFRKYPSVYDSYIDHSLFLKSRPWYAPLFQIKMNDYRSWAVGLKKSGYATDPKYAQKLIEIIEEFQLSQYDEIAELPNIKPQLKHPKTFTLAVSAEKKILFNGLKYIVVKEGESFYKIATENDIEMSDLYQFNDLTLGDKPFAGQILYLEAKRKSGWEDYHIVQQGETLKSIAQFHGIKLKELSRKNRIKPAQQPEVGVKLLLRDKKKSV